MRWRPVAPLGFPHALSRNDWIDGYLLKKGTTIIVNAWGCTTTSPASRTPSLSILSILQAVQDWPLTLRTAHGKIETTMAMERGGGSAQVFIWLRGFVSRYREVALGIRDFTLHR